MGLNLLIIIGAALLTAAAVLISPILGLAVGGALLLAGGLTSLRATK